MVSLFYSADNMHICTPEKEKHPESLDFRTLVTQCQRHSNNKCLTAHVNLRSVVFNQQQFCPSGGHLAMSGNTFDCHSCDGGQSGEMGNGEEYYFSRKQSDNLYQRTSKMLMYFNSGFLFTKTYIKEKIETVERFMCQDIYHIKWINI